MKKRVIYGLLILLPLPGLSQTLRETVEMALASNPALFAARSAAESAEASRISTIRAALPELSLKSSASVISETAEIDLARMTGLPLGSVSLGAKENYTTSLNLSYVLFSGFARQAGIKFSEKKRALARIELSRQEKETALQTAAAYRTAQLLQLKINSLQAAVERADLQLGKVRALIKTGMALGIDSLSLTLGRLTYQQQLINAESGLETARQQLSALTGGSVTVERFHADSIPTPADLHSGDSELLRSLDMSREMAVESRRKAAAVYYPRIALQASYNYGKPGVDPITNNWMAYGSAAIGMEWHLFQFGAARKRVEAQQAVERQVDYQLQNAARNLQLQYDIAVRQYKSIRQNLDLLHEALKVAREKFRLISVRAGQGMVSATEFNDANLELTQAELAVGEQQIRLLKQINEIDYISGSPLGTWHFN